VAIGMSESASGEATGSSTAGDKDVAECPTCGRTDFKSERGVKLHHKRTHGDSILGVELECEYCGDSYREKECRVDRSNYCSRGCKDNHQSTKLLSESNPNYKGRVSVQCEECGKVEEVRPSRVERYRFCSKECLHTHFESVTGEDHHRWVGRIERECKVCGDNFHVREDHAHPAEYCSLECYGDWVAATGAMSQENHPMWDPDRHDRYGPNWDSQKKKARERDGYECQYCGLPQEEHSTALHVHHSQPRSKFMDGDGAYDYKEGNKLSNLVTVCSSCHGIVEKWQLKPDKR
jgi:endogenous inhibitor of DNA gyrase (YacG/DUF329 family)